MRKLAIIIGLSFFIVGCGDDPQTVDELCNSITCSEGGTCVAGECKNPTFCDAAQTCLSGFDCDDTNKCVVQTVDLCLNVTCAAGECSQATGECINKSVCDRANPTDCIEGFFCYGQTCQDEASICAEANCSRGICDSNAAECINAPICENDVECLSGSFCSDEKVCEENKCDLNMTDCPRGQCNPRSSACEDATVCSSVEDCTDGKYCIGTQCTPIDEACLTCTGNQTCTENLNRVTCSESDDGCLNGLDCLGDRTCNQGSCGAAVACTPDANEPNADIVSATVWKDIATNGSIAGTICPGDGDFFLYNTRDSALFTGTLVVSLAVNPQNVGNGNFTIELLKTDGTSVAIQNSNNAATVELRHLVSVVDVGEFIIKVSDADLGISGLEYDLFINLVDAEADLVCQNAMPLIASVTADTTLSMSTSLKPSCAPVGVNRESVFTFEVTEKSEVTLAVARLNATISVRSSCGIDESELGCSNGTGQLVTILDPGNYYVLVEGVDADGPFDLTLTQTPVICNPGANRCAVDDSEICNASGTAYDAFSCDGDGCDPVTGFCVRAAGDVCSIAIDATQGFDGTIDFSTLRGDYESNVCGSTFSTDGLDYTFRVDLPPNTFLNVGATHDSFATLATLIVSDCNNIDQTCLSDDSGSTSETSYLNTGAQSETVFVIIDSRSSFNGSVDVKIESLPIICTPNTQACVGSDVGVCNPQGTASTISACVYGCDPQTITCNPGLNDVCATAFDVGTGGTFNGSLIDYVDDYEPETCISFGAPGPDAVWSINAVAGQVLTASMTGGFDSSLYVVSDCSDIAGTCGDGSDSGLIETINYTIPTDGIYYIITDAYSANASGTFSLTVDLVTPVCLPGTSVCMGNNLDTCRGDGSGYDTQTCPVACDANVNQCVGNSCASPIVITTAGQYTGDSSLFTNQVDPTSLPNCVRGPGNDVVYQINGTPGDIVTTSLDATFDSVIYAVNDCTGITSCLASQDTGNPEEITFVLPANGSMFVVADGFSSGNGTYTLDVAIQSPDCFNPGQPVQCLDASNLQYCDAQGFLQTLACTCSGGACTQPVGDVCADIVEVFDQTVITSTYGNFSDNYNPISCPNGISDLDGPDAVYAIDLAPNSILTVDLQSSSFGRSMYITSDCSDVSNSCLRGGGTGSVDQIVYHSAQGGRHYVHIDTSSSSATNAFTATFSVAPGVCQPDESVCDSNTAQTTTCSADGSQILSIVDCIGTCATPSACGGPVIANDTCTTAYDIVAPISFVEDLSRFTNEVNPGAGSCFAGSTPGPDLIYSVSLPPNTVLDVQVDGSGSHTVAIVSDCMMPGTTCLAQAENSGATRALYSSSNTVEDVFVFVDHPSNPSNLIDLSFDLRPQECVLGSQSCADSMTRQYCNPFYQTKIQTCDFGCAAGVCNPPTNDQCTVALDATAGGTFTGDISNYVNDYDQNNAATSCTNFSSAGPEGVWSVNAVAGQVLTATMDPTGFDASLYISTDCAMIDNTCVEGSDSGTVESVQYTIPADGVYYIIADSYLAAPTGTFTLTIDLTP